MKARTQTRRETLANVAFFLFVAALPAIVWVGLAVQCARPFICHG